MLRSRYSGLRQSPNRIRCIKKPDNIQSLGTLADALTQDHVNFLIEDIDESGFRLAVLDGDYAWHHHPEYDELFIVSEGDLIIEF